MIITQADPQTDPQADPQADPQNTSVPHRFNVRLWFVTFGLVAIFLVNTVLALVLDNYVVGQMMLREGQLSQEFLNATLKAENAAGKLFSGPGHAAALADFARHVQDLPGLLRANIYSPDLVVRFSTLPDLVGTIPEDTEELVPALAGRITTGLKAEVGDAPAAKTLIILRSDQRVMEAYVPVTNLDGSVVAVVEFYRDADGLKAVISQITLMVWGAAGIGGLLVFAALYAAMARGTDIIANQTRELQKLSLLASLGQMAQAVAHSLRNPLASIRSSVELMQIMHPHLPATEVNDVIHEVDRINTHIHELLDFSRVGTGTAQPVAVGPLLARHLDQMQPHYDRSHVRIITTGLDAPLQAAVAPHLFFQVVECIMTNALEAMSQGGEIRISLTTGAPRRLVLAFEDTGPGIAQDLVARLPEPFLTTKVQGLGLGLSISKRILEHFGGTLHFATVKPHGTRVSIVLPIT